MCHGEWIDLFRWSHCSINLHVTKQKKTKTSIKKEKLNTSCMFSMLPQFLGMSYILFYIWTGILICLTMTTLVFTIFWGLCVDNQRRLDRPCINFVQFGKSFSVCLSSSVWLSKGEEITNSLIGAYRLALPQWHQSGRHGNLWS